MLNCLSNAGESAVLTMCQMMGQGGRSWRTALADKNYAKFLSIFLSNAGGSLQDKTTNSYSDHQIRFFKLEKLSRFLKRWKNKEIDNLDKKK